MKVLVVDDNQASLEFMADSVEELGHSVCIARNGVSGLQVFRNFQPHLVISDIRMPEMDGLQLLKIIKRETPDASVVMATAYGCEKYAVEAIELGAEGYLNKPVRRPDLFALLNKYDERLQEGNRTSAVRRLVSQRHFRMEIDNRIGLLPDVIGQLVIETDGMFPKQTQASLYLGLYELLANAIEHGNLEISYEERKRAICTTQNSLGALLDERMADPGLQFGASLSKVSPTQWGASGPSRTKEEASIGGSI